MAHAGRIDVAQRGPAIMVIKREIDRERCSISGELEEADGIEGPLGGAQTW